jgi:hypothetical protein
MIRRWQRQAKKAHLPPLIGGLFDARHFTLMLQADCSQGSDHKADRSKSQSYEVADYQKISLTPIAVLDKGKFGLLTYACVLLAVAGMQCKAKA